MSALKRKLEEKVPVWRDELRLLLKEYGETQIATINIQQVYGGQRGVRALVCDTSEVPPEKGLLIRGIPVAELTGKLPEEIFYLLCTGELPSEHDLHDLQKELARRARVPDYVWEVLAAMPRDSHPMVMFNTAILVMERESHFRRRYDDGMDKHDYWEATLEDSLDLIARLPGIAAGVYRMHFEKGPRIEPRPDLDWSANYVHMLGFKDPDGRFAKMMRLYLVLHCDHESGNVSAHAAHCVASALSDTYYAVSAGLNGLAGPLHGLANQECLHWVLMVHEKFGGVPSDEDLRKFAWETLESGRVIPGYGHAVLRITDPRFDAFRAFGHKYMPDDPIFRIVDQVFRIVPDVLKQQGKAKDPWPNVDAGSGAVLYHFGLTEFSYYTVLFSVSRALGLCAQTIMSRATGEPIERPKSSTTAWLKAKAGSGTPRLTTT
jgi:citrate synthase